MNLCAAYARISFTCSSRGQSFACRSNLTVWGVEPVVTHQISWLEGTGVSGVRQKLQSAIQDLRMAQHDSGLECQLMPISTAACQCLAQVCVVLLS